MCRLIESKNETGAKQTTKILNEFSGAGLSPLDPKHNTTFYMDNQMLYAATGIKFYAHFLDFFSCGFFWHRFVDFSSKYFR